MKLAAILILFECAAIAQTANCVAPPATAPLAPVGPVIQWDTSGNGMLSSSNSGVYNFRYVQYTVGDSKGDLSHAVSAYGTIAFSNPSPGSPGTYTISGHRLDSDQASPQAFNVTSLSPGTYSIGACGLGFLSNPFLLNIPTATDQISGSVAANGVFIGSTTETPNAYNDLFIAAPANAPSPLEFNNAALTGSYSVAYMNFPGGNVNNVVTAGFQMAPNGRGGIGNVNILMYQGNGAGMDIVEPASYYFSGNTGVLNFPIFGRGIARAKVLYLSPGGNFIFGGDPQAFDLFFGVKTAPANSSNSINNGFSAGNFNGLYYQAGIDEIFPQTTGGNPPGSLQTYYGSFEVTAGTILDHQRILAPLRSSLQAPVYPPVQPPALPYQPFSYTFVDTSSLAFGSNAGYTDSATGKQYVLSADGTARLGFGMTNAMGISIALQAPAAATPSTPPPLYIDPACVINGASFAPYTAGISQGELVAISVVGSGISAKDQWSVTIGGMAAKNVEATPAPTQFGQQAPRCSQQITLTALVPTGILVNPANSSTNSTDNESPPYVQIQVMDASTNQTSNLVWEFVYNTTPGVVTESGNGLGDALAYHQNASAANSPMGASSCAAAPPPTSGAPQVTLCNPAAQGETITVRVTGLGTMPAGFGPVSGTGSSSAAPPAVSATVALIPASATNMGPDPNTPGAFDILITIPMAVAPGEAPLAIAAQDGTTAQATIPIVAAPAAKGGSGSGN